MTVTDLEPLWGIQEVSAFLRVPVNTLYQWRTRDYGPRGKRVGRFVRYRRADVLDWYDRLGTERR